MNTFLQEWVWRQHLTLYKISLAGWLTLSWWDKVLKSGLNQGSTTTRYIRAVATHYTTVGDAGEVRVWKEELEDQRKVINLSPEGLVWWTEWNLQGNLSGKPDTSSCQSRIMKETWWKVWFLHNYCFWKSAAKLHEGGSGGLLVSSAVSWKQLDPEWERMRKIWNLPAPLCLSPLENNGHVFSCLLNLTQIPLLANSISEP